MDYSHLGERASKKYIEEGVPLDESIQKIAKEESLNEHEVKRVIERANTNTFLDMFKEAEDKTFDFELADPSLTKHATEHNKGGNDMDKVSYMDNSDYSTPPDDDAISTRDREKAASAVKDLDIATEEKQTLKEKYFSNPRRTGKVLTKLASAEETIEDEIDELQIEGKSHIQRFKDHVKQAWKNGYDKEDIDRVIENIPMKKESEQLLNDALDEVHVERYDDIKEWRQHNDVDAQKHAVVNEESSLYKTAQKLDKWADEYRSKQNELETVQEMINLADDYAQKFQD